MNPIRNELLGGFHEYDRSSYELCLLYVYKTEMHDKNIGCEWVEKLDCYHPISREQMKSSRDYAQSIHSIITYNIPDEEYNFVEKLVRNRKLESIIEEVKYLKLEEKYRKLFFYI